MNERIRKKHLKKIGCYVNPKETWNLDITFAKFILPRLKVFRKFICGYPDGVFCSLNEWHIDIDKMIAAFEFISDKKMLEYIEEEKRKQYNNTVQEGLDLFRKYYLYLWW